jgi:hypothetical protein
MTESDGIEGGYIASISEVNPYACGINTWHRERKVSFPPRVGSRTLRVFEEVDGAQR